MLWLLATLSVVTISWGIAHRLKAGSRLFAARDVSVETTEGKPSPTPKDDPPTLERGAPLPRTQTSDTTHKENNA